MFTYIRVYPTTNPNILWAEFHGEAVIVATGRHTQNLRQSFHADDAE